MEKYLDFRRRKEQESRRKRIELAEGVKDGRESFEEFGDKVHVCCERRREGNLLSMLTGVDILFKGSIIELGCVCVLLKTEQGITH